MKFIVTGTFKMKDVWQKFTKEVEAENEKEALEYVYSKLGSDHKVKRHLIKVEKVEKCK